MVLKIILGLIIVVNGIFAVTFIIDLIKHKSFLKEPGNPFLMPITQFLMQLLGTFGISDFAIGASLYPKMKWVEDKKLPGTLNTACVIPVAVMALSYISSIKVDLPTLIVPIVAQVIGAYIGPHFVVKLPASVIKKFISVGLIIAALFILAGKFGFMPQGGEATSLTGSKLVLLGILMLIYGALNNIGIGSYALTMATIYTLGLSPSVAFPIMMGACTFSVSVGSMQFIKLDSYSRKITFFTAIFGTMGVLVAVFVVKSLNISMLQWVVVVVILYTAITMMLSSLKKSN